MREDLPIGFPVTFYLWRARCKRSFRHVSNRMRPVSTGGSAHLRHELGTHGGLWCRRNRRRCADLTIPQNVRPVRNFDAARVAAQGVDGPFKDLVKRRHGRRHTGRETHEPHGEFSPEKRNPPNAWYRRRMSDINVARRPTGAGIERKVKDEDWPAKGPAATSPYY